MKVIWNLSSLVLGEILEVFVTYDVSLTYDGSYPVQGFQNFQLLIQMQLSEKQETFSEFFV